MSLFNLCKWWSVQCPDYDRKYDSNSLYCCRFGLEDNEKDYVCVASQSGQLSIYQPSIQKIENGISHGFRPTDVLIETNLINPIISILSGKFQSVGKNESKQQLAVLHPMKLSIYSLLIIEGVAEHGHQTKLQLSLEYKLNKLAYSFCKGQFGGVKEREFLCVAHMDGSVKFFEQDGISHECQLDGIRYIPTMLLYVQRIDSFVTVSASYDLECFRYQDLVQSSDTVKTICPIWKTCIGEFALDFAVHQITNTESVIVILGEQNLICASDTGQIKFIKRLDYTPICMHSFIIGWYYEPDARLIITLITENGTLLLYEGVKMIWAAHIIELGTTVAVKRSNLNGLPGAMVTLNENGYLHIGYLGSVPQIFQVPPIPNEQALNIETIKKEVAELDKELHMKLNAEDVSIINEQAEKDLNVHVVINSDLEPSTFAKEINFQDDVINQQKMCQINVTITSYKNLEHVQCYFNVTYPLKCSNELWDFSDMTVNEMQMVNTWVYLDQPMNIPDLEVNVTVSFIDKHSISRVIEKNVQLPLTLCFKECLPQKESTLKISLSIEHFKISNNLLVQLFTPEFQSASSSQAIGFKSLFNNSIITIIAAKNSNRFRIQSDNCYMISVILQVFLTRLKCFVERSLTANSQEDLKIIIPPQIPIEQLMQQIDVHYNVNENLRAVRGKLEQRSKQFRLIQRKFYERIENRQATDGITMLLNDTHNNIEKFCNELNTAKKDLLLAQTNLTCLLYLTNTIVKHLDLSPKITQNLCTILELPANDWTEYSWEESISPATEMFYRTGPLRKNKDVTYDYHVNMEIEDTFDFKRFRRHFQALLEKCCALVGKVIDEGDYENYDEEPEEDMNSNEAKQINIDFIGNHKSTEHDVDELNSWIEREILFKSK